MSDMKDALRDARKQRLRRRWFGSDAFQTASIRREEGKRQRRREVIYGFCS